MVAPVSGPTPGPVPLACPCLVDAGGTGTLISPTTPRRRTVIVLGIITLILGVLLGAGIHILYVLTSSPA